MIIDKDERGIMEELTTKLNNSEFAVGALLYLYGYQTPDEQYGKTVAYTNGCGFNMTDVTILSSFAEQYIAKGFLSEKQLDLLKNKLVKYHRQLVDANITLQPIKAFVPVKKEEVDIKKNVSVEGKNLKVTFSYDPKVVEFVKTLDGRKWNAADKFWTVFNTEKNRKDLRNNGFQGVPEEVVVLPKEEVVVDDRLFGFQKNGVQQIENWDGRVILADEMGLGKTAQALSWASLREDRKPVLVVCPASLKLNWEKEAKIWVKDMSVEVLSGKKPYALKNADITIINYDLTKKWQEVLINHKFSTVILDECHYIKNQKADRTTAVQEIAGNIKYVIAISGTPITNRPIEFFPVLNLVRSDLFPSFFMYGKRYCNAYKNKFGWDFSGSSNLDELHRVLTDTCMVRRLKKDVLTDLPEKVQQVIPIEITNRKEYEKVEANVISWIKENLGVDAAEKAMKAEALVEIEKLKQKAVEGKFEASLEWIKNTLETGKLVIFATHTEIINQLMGELSEYNPVKIDGSCSSREREEAVVKFQTDDSCRVFVGNIKAAGTGITLTAASTVVFLELGWDPGSHSQAEDRIHRIGQKDGALAVYLVAVNTIEESLVGLIDEKRKVLDAALDGVKIDFSEDILFGLLGKMVSK